MARSTSRNQKKNLRRALALLGFDLHAQHGVPGEVRIDAAPGFPAAEAFRLPQRLDGLG